MAENNEYHIYVHIDGAKNKKSAVAGTGSGSTGTDSVSNSSDGVDKVANKLTKMVSFAAVKSTADKLINYEISQISLETGATEYEERLSYSYNVASQVVGAGASLALGAATGGPAGFALAAIGVVTNGIQKLVGIAQKQRQLNTEQSLENISIGMATVRAGVTGRRSANQ